MKVNLTRKTFCILGYKAGGKSLLAKTIADSYGEKALYYDTLHEVPENASFHSYPPKNRYSIPELESIINLIKTNKKYRLFLIDEANRFLKPRTPLPQAVADMNDWCRHPQFNLAVGYIARRPVQINTDIIEIADNLFIFQLGGRNDIKYLNDMRTGLGDTVQNLAQWQFVFVRQNRTWEVMNPIKANKIYIGSDTRALTSGSYT